MGAAVKITRSDEDAAALRRLAAKSADAEQSRRLLAIAMVMEGTDRAAAARLTGMDRQTLRDWVHRYNEAGPAGLTSRKAPGPAAKLTPEQMQALRKLTLDGPDPERHDVVRWRCCDLREEIAARFEVKVCERTVGKWLRKLDLTRLQPRPHHPKKDAEASARTRPQGRAQAAMDCVEIDCCMRRVSLIRDAISHQARVAGDVLRHRSAGELPAQMPRSDAEFETVYPFTGTIL